MTDVSIEEFQSNLTPKKVLLLQLICTAIIMGIILFGIVVFGIVVLVMRMGREDGATGVNDLLTWLPVGLAVPCIFSALAMPAFMCSESRIRRFKPTLI